MPSTSPRPARVRAPATIGNFGPGFDAFALAVRGLGDGVEVRPADEDAVVLSGPGAEGIPDAWDRNVAGAVVDDLRRRTGVRHRFEVRIRKRMPGGSGLGSSASSAGGTALAFAAATRRRLGPEDLVRAAAEGEARVSGRHYDDVSAVVLGGLALVRADGDRLELSRVQPPRGLHLAIVAPRLSLPTRTMRRILPARVRWVDAVHNVARAAALVDAFHRGDVPAVGACMEDRIATPARRRRIPFFDAVVRAARRSDALGVALSGSGPAMVAVTDGRRRAAAVADAMLGAVEAAGYAGEALAAVPEGEVMHHAVRVR